MTFVNEYISPEDRIKYDIDRINSQYVCVGISEQWTIDRDRNIYLRDISYGAGHSKKRVWHFFWRGHLIELSFEILGRSGSGRGSELWVHKKITNFQLPEALIDKQDEILADLNEALLCYKDGGIYATASVYHLTLDI